MVGHAQFPGNVCSLHIRLGQQLAAIQLAETLPEAALELVDQLSGALFPLRAIFQRTGIGHAQYRHTGADHTANAAIAHTAAEAAGKRDALLLGKAGDIRERRQHTLAAVQAFFVVFHCFLASFPRCHDSFRASSMIFRIRWFKQDLLMGGSNSAAS